MLDRTKVLEKAVEDCFREMYAKAQPMADWDNIVEEYKSGKIGKDEPVYNRHYLSHEEFIYILNKYMTAYRVASEWKEDVAIVEEYLEKGGSKDKYIKEHTDENGDYHPGYRSYEKVPPIKEQIFKCLCNYAQEHIAEDMTDDIYKIVMGTIKECKEFYRFDKDESDFRFTITLGASPTSNKETVKKWWKDNYNVDIEIEDRNPLLLWEMDEYGDDIDEVMKEEYGDNWEEIWWKKWEDEKKRKEEEHQKLLEELANKNKEDEQTEDNKGNSTE